VEEQLLTEITEDPFLKTYCSSLFRVKDMIFEECERLDDVLVWLPTCRHSV
jgi:hypothetical protein